MEIKIDYKNSYWIGNKMNIIEKLPDDIVIYIYTKILKKYRLHEGKLIKLIDLEKYKFLEKYISRKLVDFFPKNETTYQVRYQLNNFVDIPNRIESLVEDDMICIDLTINDTTIKYDIYMFRLKKVEIRRNLFFSARHYKSNFNDYDWRVFNYSYQIYK